MHQYVGCSAQSVLETLAISECVFLKPVGFSLRTVGSSSRTSFLSPSKKGEILHSILHLLTSSITSYSIFRSAFCNGREMCNPQQRLLQQVTGKQQGLWLSHRRPREQKLTLTLTVASRFALHRRDMALEGIEHVQGGKTEGGSSRRITADIATIQAINKYFLLRKTLQLAALSC